MVTINIKLKWHHLNRNNWHHPTEMAGTIRTVVSTRAQELFVFTDPASNVPAGSMAVRIGQSFLKNDMDGGNTYSLSPELTWGMNKNLMFRVAGFFDNAAESLDATGAGFYTKYRFYSIDDMQSHFRMAAFGRYSWNKSMINHQDIDLDGLNSGYEAGIVATQLIKKLALSSTVSYVKALDNHDFVFPAGQGSDAVNYTFSAGRLMHPKKYTNFEQTNVNLMLEFAGQANTVSGKSYLDIMPSVQFIINSQARIDVAYKKELYSSMDRFTTDGVFLKLEYTFFNLTG